MLSAAQLKDLLHDSRYGRREKALLILAVKADVGKSVADVRKLAYDAGFREISKWNVSDVLSRNCRGLAILVHGKWELNDAGRDEVETIAKLSPRSRAASKVAKDLRALLSGIKDENSRVFAEEAIGAYERDLYRSAVVLSWVGAVALLHDHVVDQHLNAFNIEANKRMKKWKDAKNADDVALMPEGVFLDVLEKLSVIGHNVKSELQKALKLRNGCGHPNTLRIGPNAVAAHLEVLVLNVFQRF